MAKLMVVRPSEQLQCFCSNLSCRMRKTATEPCNLWWQQLRHQRRSSRYERPLLSPIPASSGDQQPLFLIPQNYHDGGYGKLGRRGRAPSGTKSPATNERRFLPAAGAPGERAHRAGAVRLCDSILRMHGAPVDSWRCCRKFKFEDSGCCCCSWCSCSAPAPACLFG